MGKKKIMTTNNDPVTEILDEILTSFKNYIVESITLQPTIVECRKLNERQASKELSKMLVEARIDELNSFQKYVDYDDLLLIIEERLAKLEKEKSNDE